jgi:hypothetical protein
MRIVCKIHKPVKKDLLETIVFALKKISEEGMNEIKKYEQFKDGFLDEEKNNLLFQK